MKNKVFFFSFVIVVFGIGVLSLIPPKSGIELGDHDKWNHFLAYSTLALNWTIFKDPIKKCFGLGLEHVLYMGCFLSFYKDLFRGGSHL